MAQHSIRIGATAESYRTTFPSVEAIISEGNRWRNGQAVGTEWRDFKVPIVGRAHGTQTATSPPYRDSCAYLETLPGRSWGANQDLRGRVYLTSRAAWGGGFHEVELLGRGAISAGDNKCYEILFSMNDGTTYTEIARWNGPLGIVQGGGGAYTTLAANTSFTAPANGSWVRATIVGTLIKAYVSADGSSWTEVNSYDTSGDGTKYATGMPGMGHWKNDAASVADTYGFTELIIETWN